jgi:ABC-type Na+ transport system ATPase subunit NatA
MALAQEVAIQPAAMALIEPLKGLHVATRVTLHEVLVTARFYRPIDHSLFEI